MKTNYSFLKKILLFFFVFISNFIWAQRQNNYDLNSGNGKGIRFWNGSDKFKIHMGSGTYYKFGPVQDYSIKTNMDGTPSRGFTWGSTGKVPIAGLDINGNFEIAGDFTSNNITLSPPPELSSNFFTSVLKFTDKNGKSQYSLSYGLFPSKGSGELLFRGSVFNFKATNKVIFSGNVGIGTENPEKKLSVKGDSHITGNLSVDNGININDSKDLIFVAEDNDAGDVIFQKGNGSQIGRIWTSTSGGNLHFSSIDNIPDMTIDYFGRVGIGTLTPKNKLSVNGHIWAKEIKVKLTDGADWVFEEDYELKPLAEVEKFIIANKHLPEIPSADEFRANDMKVSEMTNKLLQKIEELTLYTIAQDKLLKLQEEKNKTLEKRLAKLELLLN